MKILMVANLEKKMENFTFDIIKKFLHMILYIKIKLLNSMETC